MFVCFTLPTSTFQHHEVKYKAHRYNIFISYWWLFCNTSIFHYYILQDNLNKRPAKDTSTREQPSQASLSKSAALREQPLGQPQQVGSPNKPNHTVEVELRQREMLCYRKENNTLLKQILEAVKEKPRATVTDLATPDQTRCFHLELDPAVTVE